MIESDERHEHELEHDNVLPTHDENAFGILVGWLDAENAEYSQSADKFPPRLRVWRSAFREFLTTHPLAHNASVLDFGTVLYAEFADGDQLKDPIAWLRELRSYLNEGDWLTFGAVAYGGRWVSVESDFFMPPAIGDAKVIASWGPSEPFTRLMACWAMAHDDEDDGREGWGSGMFVDADVLEALEKKLKNEPTPLRAGGGCFFRIGA